MCPLRLARCRSTLLVYGGYSQRCKDFCSDMWTLNITKCERNQTQCLWKQIAVLNRDGPGQ